VTLPPALLLAGAPPGEGATAHLLLALAAILGGGRRIRDRVIAHRHA
jgi:hypothetical protein